MTTKAAVAEVVSCKRLALVGMSRSGKKFGNVAGRELQAKGYEILPIHPLANQLEGLPCYRTFADLPGPVGAVIVVVPPAEAAKVVHEALEAGISRVWLQPGSESPEAIAECENRGAVLVVGHCILMFAEPVRGIHRLHRFLSRLFGQLPC